MEYLNFIARALGQLDLMRESVSLLSQSGIKEDSKTIKNLVEDTIAKVGEKIEFKRFTIYEI